MKTNELIGPALDWLVAECEGHEVWLRHDFLKARHAFLESKADLAFHLGVQDNLPIIASLETGSTAYLPRYSEEWAIGGPLTQKYQISIHYCTDTRERYSYYVHAECESHRHHGYAKGHDTPLLAAMRCLVGRKMGDEVELPVQLC